MARLTDSGELTPFDAIVQAVPTRANVGIAGAGHRTSAVGSVGLIELYPQLDNSSARGWLLRGCQRMLTWRAVDV